MKRGRTKREARRRDRGMSGVALVAGVAGLTAAIAASVIPGLPGSVSASPGWGLAWGEAAVGADAAVVGAVAERLAVVSGLLAVVATQGLYTVLLLLLGERDRRGAIFGVRSALGAGAGALFGYIAERDGRRTLIQLALGLLLGLIAAGVVRATWPALGLTVAPSVDSSWSAPTLVAIAGALLLWVCVALGLSAPLVGLEGRIPAILRRGHGVTDDPRAGTVRRGATTVQLAGAVAFALTGLGLVEGLPGEAPMEPAMGAAEEAAAPSSPMISRFASASPTRFSDELLASPGAWRGVGVRDLVTVECGACVVGIWYLPIYGVDSTVHAVGAEVLDALGAEIVEGRGIVPSDSVGAPLVGVVNEAFRQHFEGREPLGRRIRLSGRGERWVEIVGVVRDPPLRGPGAPGSNEPVLWLSLAQHPASVVEGEITPDGSVGLGALSEPIPLDRLQAAALAPAVWSGWALLFSGAAALLLALVSAVEVGRVEARGTARATAVRLAVGGPPRRLAVRLLGRTARLSAAAVGVGLAVSWVLRAAVGGGSIGSAVSNSGASPWLALFVLLAAVGGAVPRARAVLELEPARLLRGE